MTPPPKERVRELMDRVLEATGVDADVEVYEDPEGITGEFVGEDLGLLIGHHGQTIDAIQHIAYRIAFQGLEDRKGVAIDASGYRERRAELLRSDGDRAADTAVREGRPVSLEAMTPLERKVVHEHLRERHDVETYSEGQEPSRRLVVTPLVD
ncbi:MAG: Jag family protein [Solirubrobacteraceae bacterium]